VLTYRSAQGDPEEGVDGVRYAGVVHILQGSPDGVTPVGDQVWTQNSPGVQGKVEVGDSFGEVIA